MINESVVIDVLRYMSEDGDNPPILRLLVDHFYDYDDHLSMLKHVYRLHDLDRDGVSRDAWTNGQISSKHWLLSTLAGLDMDLGDVWILCGWVGSLAMMMNHRRPGLRHGRIRSFDVDQRCAALAESLNRPTVRDGWRFKATTMDINEISYVDFQYATERYDGSEVKLIETADTIINTSCDHMGDDSTWWDNIPAGKLVILQNNDFVDVNEHDNLSLIHI